MANLLDKASILLTPTAYDNGSMLSVKPTDGDGDFTFSRNGDASRVNSSGIIVTEGANLPRINYENGCGSWLLEDESTNLIPYSSDFSLLNAVANAVVTSNQIISPSGLLDADEITFDGTLYGRVEASLSVTNGATYTISVYLKNKDLSDVTQVWIGFAQTGQGQFITITDEWQRYEITLAANGTTEYPRIQFSGSGSLYAWGFQTEQQSYATSYIPTSGATSTRLQDLASGSGNSTLINSTEGVLYAEIARNANEGSSPGIQINDGSSNNNLRLFFNQANTISVITRVGGSNNVVKTAQAITSSTAMNKFALVYKLNDYKLYYNGAELWNDTSASVYPVGTLNNLDFLNQTTPFKGEVKALAVFPYLTDAELTALTTI